MAAKFSEELKQRVTDFELTVIGNLNNSTAKINVLNSKNNLRPTKEEAEIDYITSLEESEFNNYLTKITSKEKQEEVKEIYSYKSGMDLFKNLEDGLEKLVRS